MSRIREFYAGQNVFITGTTGFLGQILLEKLLRDCREIEAVFILIRAKKGKSIEERVDKLLAEPVFDVLRSEYPDFAKKIVTCPGDISQERLGLSATDYECIVSKVSVIFHLAATVRFNEELDVATAINTNSVKHIVDIAKDCKNLKAGVHVSTAYSHCVRDKIGEELYLPPLSYEAVNKLIKTTVENDSSEDARKDVTAKVLGKWPNTYTFTKAIGESVVVEYAKKLPFAIFRPSIVMNAYAEPMPGWVPGPIGYQGILCGAALGLIHVLPSDLDNVIDLIPVDYACNALIACAWETAVTERRCDEDIPVYNYVSRSENPITWRKFQSKSHQILYTYPFNSAVYYPFEIMTTSETVFNILEFLLHLIPALIIDRIAVLVGKKPQFYKLARKIGNGLRAFSYFSTQQWNFENPRVQNLWKRVTSDDKRIFPFSMRALDWDEYISNFTRGCRKYIVGESEDNLDEARRRRFYLYIIHSTVRLLTATFVLWIVWISLRGLGLKINT